MSTTLRDLEKEIESLEPGALERAVSIRLKRVEMGLASDLVTWLSQTFRQLNSALTPEEAVLAAQMVLVSESPVIAAGWLRAVWTHCSEARTIKRGTLEDSRARSEP